MVDVGADRMIENTTMSLPPSPLWSAVEVARPDPSFVALGIFLAPAASNAQGAYVPV